MLDSLENVKERLNISSDDYDDFLTSQITLISDTIEAYCRRRFLSAEYEQTFYRTDNCVSKKLELFHYPVSEIDSIMQDGVELDEESYRLNKPTGFIRNLDGYFFGSEETVITYTAGFEDCPTPVLSVLDSLVLERYNRQISAVGLNFGSDVQRISIPGAISIDFDYTLANNERRSAFGVILGSNVNILDSYRSERAVLGDGRLIYIEDIPVGP